LLNERGKESAAQSRHHALAGQGEEVASDEVEDAADDENDGELELREDKTKTRKRNKVFKGALPRLEAFYSKCDLPELTLDRSM